MLRDTNRSAKDRGRCRTSVTVSAVPEPDDAAAFAALVREVADPVRRYLWRRTDSATADDVLSETLMVLWRRSDQVPAEHVPWAIGIARLQLQNAHRSTRRQGLLQARIVALDPPSIATPGPDDRPDDGEAVRRVLALMPEAEQELLRLSAWDELAPAQIAAVLGISANAASIRLHRARKRFAVLWRKDLAGDGHPGVKEGQR